jgi:hypothetical protein
MGPLPFGYNIDAIAACGGGLLLVGGSNFSGRCWTGTVALVDVSGADGPRLQTVLPQRAGIPAVCSLSVADEFTGRRWGVLTHMHMWQRAGGRRQAPGGGS